MGEHVRLYPVRESSWTDYQRELLDYVGVKREGANNLFETIIWHPGLFRRWAELGAKLLFGGTLGARHRELLILRTAFNCRCLYEIGHHREIAIAAGVDADDIAKVLRDEPGEWTDGIDSALIDAADELHSQAKVTGDTWRALQSTFDEKALIEIPMLVGHYHLVAYLAGMFQIEEEDDSARPAWLAAATARADRTLNSEKPDG